MCGKGSGLEGSGRMERGRGSDQIYRVLILSKNGGFKNRQKMEVLKRLCTKLYIGLLYFKTSIFWTGLLYLLSNTTH